LVQTRDIRRECKSPNRRRAIWCGRFDLNGSEESAELQVNAEKAPCKRTGQARRWASNLCLAAKLDHAARWNAEEVGCGHCVATHELKQAAADVRGRAVICLPARS
jgi:hypothetical protein